ncbi:MAG: InlB B-repeat-containing protein [Oscillospiraceae bacterium]
MKKRILSILLLCCMVLTMLPTTVLAADGPMDTIPKYDVSIDVYNRTSDISIKDSRSYYIYSSVPDKLRDTWAWDKKIFIKGDKTAPHVFIDGVNIKMSPSSLGPAIELNKKASAYIYFIGKNSSLQGADGRAAIQKNRSEGQLYVLARTGTTVTCKGGDKAAGIGGSYATRNISNGYYNGDMYGHGVNMHFGSQSNPDYWGGIIAAIGGNGGAGIGGGQGGAGEKLYFYSGTIQATSDRFASGIGGSYEGRGSEIYIYGGTVSAQGGEGGAGIGGGCWKTEQDMNGINAAHDIYISGGTVTAKGGYNGAGIGGGQYVPARNITVTGGVVTATGHYGAAIGGGRWCHGMDITLTDATLNLSTNYRSNGSNAAAVGYGDIVYKPEQLVADPSIATNDRIKVGSKNGKIVMLTANGHALRTDGKPSYFMHLTDFLIPDSDGMIDLSLLTLPYTQNYGWAITDLDMKMMETSCEGNHVYGWKDWNGCHVWGCTRCPARDPLKSGPAPDGEHIPGEWESQEKKCTVCGHKLMKDTTPPVIEGITNGMEYTADDTDDGQPGTISFTVSDPVRDKEVSSGVKSVTINGEEQTVQTGQAYQLTAPDGGNNDEGLVYEVVVTDNAGNSTTTKITLYRRHRVLILSDRNDPSSAILHLGVPHGFELELPFDNLPKEAYFVDWDNEDIKISRGENNDYNFGIINSNRTFLQVIPETELPTLELGLRSRRFWGYHADSESDFCYADMPSKTEEGYLMDIRVTSNKIGYYFGSPVRYTQEQLKALDVEGKIKWTQFDTTSLLTFDVISYEEYNGSWYYYAKATNEVGTRYVSTPNIIIDADPAVALEYPSGKELTGKYRQTESGTYWGDLQFTVVDESEFTVKDGSTPLEPDENGVYTIKADMDEGIKHEIVIMDAGNNRTAYINEIRMNTLDRRDNPSALNLPNGANLEESLPKTVRILTARDSSMFTNIPVIWEIPETYEQASKREQSFTVNGTLDLSGTDIVLHPDKTELGKAQISVTIAGAPRYTLTIADSANGSITVVNATETAEDGKPLFFKDELVMLSIAPDEGYMLSALSVNGIPATVAVGDDTYTFAQPEENVTITATFEKRNEHTVTFDANGGSEPEDLPEEVTTAMPAKKVLHGSAYYLPECEFVAPEGKQFKAWQIDGTEYPVNAPVTVTADITVKALWEDAPPAPAEYTVTVTTEGNGTASASPAKAVAGEEITLTATPDGGYRFKEWEVISGGVTIKDDKFTMPDGNVEIKAIFEEDAPPVPTEFTITVTSGGNGTASASHAKAVAGTEIRLTATPKTGYHFKEWEVISGGVTIVDDKFLMPNDNVEVKAIFEKDAPPAPTDPAKPSISVIGTYTYNGSEHTATVIGYDSATMDITGNTATDAGDYTVSVTSQTGKWADGSTDAVTAAWSIGKATQEAPTGLIGVAPTTEGGGDGKITGVTDKMEYRMAGESSYTACGGTEIENLSAGNYFVRYAEDNNHFASSDAEVTVGDGEPLADFIITFNGNGGSGSMGPVTVKAGTNYILPACGFTAPADQEFKAWQIGGTEYKVGDTYTVSGDTEIKALWENSVITPTTYTVTVSNDGNGTGTATPSTAATGTEITLTAMPKEGYHFKEWQVESPTGLVITNNKFLMPNGNVEVKAIFEEDAPPAPTEHTITVTSGGNGTASASHAKAVVGTEIRLTATPNKGYHFKEWEVMSGGVTIKDNKFIMPNDNVEVKAIFEKDAPAPTEYTITYDLAGGTAEGNPDTYTIETRTFTLTNPTKSGYTFTGWSGTGLTGENNLTVTIEKGSTGDRSYTAHWRYNGSGHSYSYYTIKATAGAGGSISPSGNVSVREGRDQTFTITPDKGYAVANVKIDGKSIGAVKSYTFENVSRTHTIEVIFMKANGNPQTGVFVDVATGSYYEDAVDWAVENGITKGTDDTHFSPDGICTRAQAVTFLWRTAGSPASKTSTMPFTDVPVGSYYYDAVLWAVENGITKGTSDTTFSPNMTCSRAQIVTFLWRSEKSPAAGTANPFADVKSTAYYADAVLWAVKENITKGTTSTTFSPNADCTRAQIVTFLWRCKK